MSQWDFHNNFGGKLAVTDSAWITAEAFHNWFQWIVETVTARPLLLVFDGYASHLSYETITLLSCQIVKLAKSYF